MATHQARIVLSTNNLSKDISFLSDLGFELDNIFPADNPKQATVSGHGLTVCLDREVVAPPATIHILTDSPDVFRKDNKELVAPNGTSFVVLPKTNVLKVPSTEHKLEVTHLGDHSPWVVGRAGMLYRDLIPSRLGGSIIASLIHIPNGGPVPDNVHFHFVKFQLIYCFNGWVKLVYEDQGDPLHLSPGDCVIQPPEIRHRVLEASDNLQVIEVGVPAEHMTTIDRVMELPTSTYCPRRQFAGQTFCHSVTKDAVWLPWRMNGFEYRDTGITAATRGLASVHIAHPFLGGPQPGLSSHKSDILFTFVLSGDTELSVIGQPVHLLSRGDSFVIPPHSPYRFSNYSADFEILEVSLPGNFETENHS